MSYNDEGDELTGGRSFMMAGDDDEEAEPLEEGEFPGDIEEEDEEAYQDH